MTLITFEGCDGVGKTTQLQLLYKYTEDRLQKQGTPDGILRTREPGGTPVAEKIRAIVMNTPLACTTELLLHMAARAENVHKVISPALEQKKVVLCDRFIDSTIAYQCYGRCPGDFGFVKYVSEMHKRIIELMPKITILIDMDVNERRTDKTGEDIYHNLDLSFMQRVRDGFLERAREEPERVIVVSGVGTEDEVHKRIVGKLREHKKIGKS